MSMKAGLIKKTYCYLTSVVFIILSINSYAQDNVCSVNTCSGLPIPTSVKKIIATGYEGVGTTNILGSEYLIATTKNDINKCSVIFPITKSGISNKPVNFDGNPFCNYSISNDKVVSHWKDSAKWYEDIYQVKNSSWLLVFRDECIGCDSVKRNTFENGKIVGTSLMSDADDFSKREKIIGFISANKEYILKTANSDDKSKSYLIKGDAFEISDMSEEGNYYKITYKMKSGKNLSGWISSDAFTIKK